MKEKMQRHSITMTPLDWATVAQVAKDMGLDSRSAGVRFIIRDWERLKAAKQGYQFDMAAQAAVGAPIEAAAGE